MNRYSLLVLVPLVVLLQTACAFNRGTVGDELKTAAVSSIKKGVTTRAEVVSTLGAPDRIVAANGRDILQYYRYDIKAGSLLLILVNFSRLSIKSDDLYVFLDRNGLVDDVIFSRRTDGMEFRFWPFDD
jgi:outer membrane protein assembly factor BamE (lipoprotein component of BamABCDE complex)